MPKLFRISAFAALALGATALTAQAQEKSFGIIGGVTFATLSGSDADGGYIVDPELGSLAVNKGSRTGFAAGLFVDIPAGRALVFEPQALYVGKGVKYTVSDGSTSVDATLALGYIDVPLLLRYNFETSGGVYFLLGPDVGFNISCSVSASGGGQSANSSCADGVTNGVTIGGIGGIGFQKGKIGIEGRYEFDFGAAIQDSNAKNAVWEILLRYVLK